MTLSIIIRDWARRLVGSLEHDRLANFLTEAWTDFDREVHSSGHTVLTEPWTRSAYTLLLRAEADLASWQIEGGWAIALSAQRAILSNPHNPERIQRAAIALRREADKITGWRAKAIQDLICGPKGEVIPIGPGELMRVIDAVALRDDFSQNTWFKILLRRRHLLGIFLILWSAILLFLVLSWLQILPGFLGEASQVSAVVLFGVLGAAVSVAQSLVAQDVSERIPAQQIGALVVWMRPGIGAAASLVVFALLHANQHFRFLGQYTTEPAVIAVFSFLAGYSERFIMGALERLSQSATKERS
jgi:hypothetical protein